MGKIIGKKQQNIEKSGRGSVEKLDGHGLKKKGYNVILCSLILEFLLTKGFDLYKNSEFCI